MTYNNNHFSGKTDYDSDFCGSIPLNFINLVQAQGVLLVLDRNTFDIIQASENSLEILGIGAPDLVQKPLQAFINEAYMQQLRDKMERWHTSRHVPLHLSWKTPEGINKNFSGTLHSKNQYLLLELEENIQQASEHSFAAIYQSISYAITSLKEAKNLIEVANVAVHELKRLSGFDRVMVYRFDEQWNGTVIAEAQESGMAESYLGLRFPASDVPRQARELYTRTPFRIIPNIAAPAARLYPVVNPVSRSLTDISECILRAVPLVHLEYLQNMGVVASMSTPIIVDNKLWGLISCHHRSAKPVSFELRTSFEIISGIIAAQISTREKEESFRYRSQLHSIELKLIEQIYRNKSLSTGLMEEPAYLMELLGVQGLAMTVNNEYITAGEVPDERMVRSLIKWLSRYSKEKVFATDSLPRLFDEATHYRNVAGGLIAIQIIGGKQYLLGFRPEVIQSVNWGGNPNEAIQMTPDGNRYHPRNSFNLWREKVELTSLPWYAEVLEVAQHIRTAILEKLLKEEEIF